MKFFTFLLILISTEVLSQSQDNPTNSFKINLQGALLQVTDETGDIILERLYNNPVIYVTDLDGDLSEELLLIDSTAGNAAGTYILYIYNTIDSFYLADSILSGAVEPYYTVPEDLDEVVIVTGNDEFSYLDKEKNGYLPLNCWKYESGELYGINDEVYDIFIAETESLITLVDDYFDSNIKNCNSSEKMKGPIAAAYINYINAGEQSLASQFIKNYYLCSDIEQFKAELDQLILNQDY